MNNFENFNSDNTENSQENPWEDMAKTAPAFNPNAEKPLQVEVKNLAPDDNLERAGALLYEVDPLIFPDFFGDSERAKQLAPALFNNSEKGLFSFNRTLVAEVDGEIMGILCYRTSEVDPWDKESVKSRFEQTGVELPDNFDRANEGYMKKITDAELPEGAAEIEFLATAPEARGKGIATKLIEDLKNSGKFTELHLDVLGNNENAMKLYEKRGFVAVDEFPCYPDGSIPVYHMVTKLDGEQ